MKSIPSDGVRPRPPGPTRDEVLAELKARAAAWNVPYDYAERQMAAESSYNPNVGTNSSGATGLMQVKPSTVAEIANKMAPARTLDPYNWRDNIEAGMRIDRHLLDAYGGNRVMAAAGYAGEHNVAKNRLGDIPPPNTWRYVAKLVPDWTPFPPQADPYPPLPPPGPLTYVPPRTPSTWERLTQGRGLFGPQAGSPPPLRR